MKNVYLIQAIQFFQYILKSLETLFIFFSYK